MDFLDLYLLLEKKQYGEFDQHFNESKIDINQSQQLILEVTRLIKVGQMDKAREKIKTTLDGNKNLSDMLRTILEVKLVSIISLVGDNSTTKEYIQKIQNYYDNNQSLDELNQLVYGDFLNYAGIFYTVTGNLERSAEYFSRALKHEKSLNNQYRLAKVDINFSVCKSYQGKYTESLSMLYEAKNILERLDDTHSLAQTFGNISEILEMKGDYETALYYNRRAHTLFQKFDNKEEIAMNLSNQAKIFSKLGNYSTTKNIFEKTLQIRRNNPQTTYPVHFAKSMVNYIIYKLKYEDTVSEELEELKRFSMEYSDNRAITIRYEFALALEKYYGKDLIKKVEAISELEKLDELSTDVEAVLHNKIVKHTIDGFLFQYRATKDSELLDVLHNYFEKLSTLADNQNSLILHAQSKILEIQLYIYQNKYQKAEVTIANLVGQVFNIGMPHLLHKLEILNKQLEKLKSSNTEFISKDLVISIDDFLYPEETSENGGIDKVNSVFLLTQYQDVVNIYGHVPDTIQIFENNDVLFMDNYQFIRYYGNQTLLILKGSFPWIGGIFEGNLAAMIQRLRVIRDSVSLHMLDETEELTGLQIDSELSTIIENFIEEQFSEEDTDFSPSKSKLTYSDLQHYELLLHPIRLSIMHTIYRYFEISRADLRKYVGGNKSTFTLNLDKLIDADLLIADTQFIDGNPRKVIYITQKGIQLFNQFNSLFDKQDSKEFLQ